MICFTTRQKYIIDIKQMNNPYCYTMTLNFKAIWRTHFNKDSMK